MAGPAAISLVEDNFSLKYLERGREKYNSIPLVENRDSNRKEFKNCDFSIIYHVSQCYKAWSEDLVIT